MMRCDADGDAEGLALGDPVPPPDGVVDGVEEGLAEEDGDVLADALAAGEFDATFVDAVQPATAIRTAAAPTQMRHTSAVIRQLSSSGCC